MNEQQILARWEQDKQAHLDWGLFIASVLAQQLAEAISPTPLDSFLKLPPTPRLKANTSLVDKALHRGKSYQDPYADITDKVGLRYVLLLTSHIHTLCSIIEAPACSTFWSHSKDRDYEQERLARPLEFSYQSVHYVLRSRSGHTFQERPLPEGLCCEVQVRSLLQHAYSELTHDTLYKPTVIAQPSVKRTVARSMALIETTDQCFLQAMQDLDAASEPQRRLLDALQQAYRDGTGLVPAEERSNQLVVDALAALLPPEPVPALHAFLASKGYVFTKIQQHQAHHPFFRQPAVLLAYYLAATKPNQIQQHWPIDDAILNLVFSDLGRAFP